MGRKRERGPRRKPRKTGGVKKGSSRLLEGKREAIVQLKDACLAIASFNPAINFMDEDRAKALRECTSLDPSTRSRRKLLIYR